MTKEELIKLLQEESDTSINAGTIIALESLEESIKDWRFNLLLRLFPGFLLQTLKKALKEVS
jgi:DNA-binding HxlR family transcriptional regulator